MSCTDAAASAEGGRYGDGDGHLTCDSLGTSKLLHATRRVEGGWARLCFAVQQHIHQDKARTKRCRSLIFLIAFSAQTILLLVTMLRVLVRPAASDTFFSALPD